jgi:outer membrane protein
MRKFARESTDKFMNKKTFITVPVLSLMLLNAYAQDNGVWNLKGCIDYALEHSIKLKQSKIKEESSAVDVKQNKAALFPSLSFSMSQNVTWRPYQESGSSFVNDGIATSHKSNVSENGTYGVNAAWTVWNGGINRKNIKDSQYSQEMAQYATEVQANSIQEQIAQLYIQILYSTEALKVNEEVQKTAQSQYERGQEMVKQGQMAKSELAQLEAQVTAGEYNIVNSKSLISNYKLQLKQLLEIEGSSEMQIADIDNTDEAAMAIIPDEETIYQAALESRPEIKSAEVNIEAMDNKIKIAKAGYLPTISLQAGVGDSHTSGIGTNIFTQMKNNLNASGGLNFSLPILDRRQNKSAVERAKLNKQDAELELQNQRKTLLSTIEKYRLDATTGKQKYIAAKSNVKSMQESYNLINEQFRVGLKNSVDVMTSRDNLIQAEQEMLQSKYTTLLNLQLLEFYRGGIIDL